MQTGCLTTVLEGVRFSDHVLRSLVEADFGAYGFHWEENEEKMARLDEKWGEMWTGDDCPRQDENTKKQRRMKEEKTQCPWDGRKAVGRRQSLDER